MAQSLVFIILFKSCDSVIHVMKGILFDTRVGREMMFSSATSFMVRPELSFSQFSDAEFSCDDLA